MKNFVFLFCFLFLLLFVPFFLFQKKLDTAREREEFSIVQMNEVSRQLRIAEEEKKNKKMVISLMFVGDVMLSRSVEKKIQENNDQKFPFLSVAERLTSADIAIGNLEGPISLRGKNQGSIYSFRANPKVIGGIQYAGLDLFSLANNHIFDWGRDALEDTMSILSNSNIHFAGVGRNYNEANTPTVILKKGYKVGFLSFTNLYPRTLFATDDDLGISEYDEKKILEHVAEMRKENDVAVVLLHWGNEYEVNSNGNQKKFARELIDAGADIVVGHHPHVAQEIENYKNGIIAYSLGNFVFDQNFSKETMSGLMLDVTCTEKHTCNAKPVTVLINSDFQPSFLEL
ncbi:MAG: CapA family protein [Candidatus Paceibacterota bacterium]|jgi:poly-gamma-glutamate synthesis protein (capsule biosynthesis protein)